MISLDKSYTVDNGLSFDDNVGIFTGENQPSSEDDGGVPEGSIYIQYNNGTSNKLWQKTGPLISDWTEIGTESQGILNIDGGHAYHYPNDTFIIDGGGA